MVAKSLCRIALAPESVKVKAKIPSGGVSVFFKIWAIRSAIIWVLPVPGPAITITGPSMVSTASLWAGFNFIQVFWVQPAALTDLRNPVFDQEAKSFWQHWQTGYKRYLSVSLKLLR